jgi:hypothetical protein
MARIFTRYFGKGAAQSSALARARGAELRGELDQAASLFAEAGRLDEAARVMILRGDAETDPAARLRHYIQAAGTAPPDSSVQAHARRKRWMTVLSLSAAEPLSATLREDLERAATELEAMGEHTRAAEAFARLGDAEGRARSLAGAGDVEELERFLDSELSRDRHALANRRASEDFELFVASGQRREAMAVARASADEALRERGRSTESRRVVEGGLTLVLRGHEMKVSLGNEVVIGRAPDPASVPHSGTIAISSAALSRKHLAVARSHGEAIVRDLGSRNKTTLRGLTLAGEVPVGAGIELRLGGEVTVIVRPASDDEFPGGVVIEVAGKRYVAPLGPATLGVGRWRLECAADRWVELCTEDQPPAFAKSLRLPTRVALLSGDAIGTERGGDPLLVIG